MSTEGKLAKVMQDKFVTLDLHNLSLPHSISSLWPTRWQRSAIRDCSVRHICPAEEALADLQSQKQSDRSYTDKLFTKNSRNLQQASGCVVKKVKGYSLSLHKHEKRCGHKK